MKVSILVPVSRPEFVNLVKKNLTELDLAGHEAELIIIVDNNKLTEPWEMLEGKYPKMKVHHVNNGFKPPSGNIPRIRDRIANVRNESRELVGKTDFVFSFEDDCEVPSHALRVLYEHWQELSRKGPVGLVSGIQVGRHGVKILGAWFVDNLQFPNEATSLGKNEVVTQIAEVHGTGMYCYLTPTKLYKAATYGWHEPVGPDVWYGLFLRLMGYKNYVDQRLVIGHRIKDMVLRPDNVDVKKIRYFPSKGAWTFEVVKDA